MENKRIIQVDEKVPFKMLVPLSIQHMFAMFGASCGHGSGSADAGFGKRRMFFI